MGDDRRAVPREYLQRVPGVQGGLESMREIETPDAVDAERRIFPCPGGPAVVHGLRIAFPAWA